MHAIHMDIAMFVIAAAVMAASTLTLVDAPILTPVAAPMVTAVMKKIPCHHGSCNDDNHL